MDYALAPYVDKSFKKAIAKNFDFAYDLIRDHHCPQVQANDIADILAVAKYREDDNGAPFLGYHGRNYDIHSWVMRYAYGILKQRFDTDTVKVIVKAVQEAYHKACKDVEEETKQAMEAMIFNFNTLHSRAGSQTPFSSINFGMDTSPEGRLIIKYTLEAINAGLGNGETSIFPIAVFQLKSGVNYNEGDPNYDLFKRACEVSAKRLYPNFVNVDASFNLPYYKPGNPNSAISTMG